MRVGMSERGGFDAYVLAFGDGGEVDFDFGLCEDVR